jgi:hypothetical protein
MEGLFTEMGPFTVNEDLTLRVNPQSWHRAANVLFVDQPVGTGLAFTSHSSSFVQNQAGVNEQFYTFLQSLFKLHPQYISSGKGVYFFGESYAGHYIPSIVAHIMRQNQLVEKAGLYSKVVIDVRGIGIGNGWISPMQQYGTRYTIHTILTILTTRRVQLTHTLYSLYVGVDMYAHASGLISAYQATDLRASFRRCQKKLRSGVGYWPPCLDILDVILSSSGGNKQVEINPYDVRKWKRKGGGGSAQYPPGMAGTVYSVSIRYTVFILYTVYSLLYSYSTLYAILPGWHCMYGWQRPRAI